MEKDVSVERCLNVVPNKFELTVLVINRAKELFLGASSEVADGKYTKKQINKALVEIEKQIIDMDALREKIKEFIMNNELFSKEMKPTVAADNVIDDDSGDDGATAGEELKDADFDDEDSDFDLSVSDDDLEDEE